MREYLFDVKLFASVRVNANNIAEARKMLNDVFDCADANFGAWPDGDPVTAEASQDGDADLIEIDGEDVSGETFDETRDFCESDPDVNARLAATEDDHVA